MRQRHQLSFFKNKSVYSSWRQLGGSSLKSHPKRRRPVSTKHENHIVLKSQLRGSYYSLRSKRNLSVVDKLVFDLAKRFKIKIRRYENMGNHLHLLVTVPTHASYNQYIKGLTSAVARHVLSISKKQTYLDLNGSSPSTENRFWAARPFTRIVTWGRDRLGLLKYLDGNRISAVGFDQFVEEKSVGYKLTG